MRRPSPVIGPGARFEGVDYWALSVDEVARRLCSSRCGLTAAEAAGRLASSAASRQDRGASRWRVLLNQLRSPLLLLLVFAAAASLATRAWVDAVIVVTIVMATVAVGYSREYSAQAALALLRNQIHTRVRTLRDGRPVTVDVHDVVPGDVVLLSAGSLVPGRRGGA